MLQSTLLLQWQQLQETNREKALSEWLPSFYETLLTTWHREVTLDTSCNNTKTFFIPSTGKRHTALLHKKPKYSFGKQ